MASLQQESFAPLQTAPNFLYVASSPAFSQKQAVKAGSTDIRILTKITLKLGEEKGKEPFMNMIGKGTP